MHRTLDACGHDSARAERPWALCGHPWADDRFGVGLGVPYESKGLVLAHDLLHDLEPSDGPVLHAPRWDKSHRRAQGLQGFLVTVLAYQNRGAGFVALDLLAQNLVLGFLLRLGQLGWPLHAPFSRND